MSESDSQALTPSLQIQPLTEAEKRRIERSLYVECIRCKHFRRLGELTFRNDPIGTCLSPQGRFYGQRIEKPNSSIKCQGYEHRDKRKSRRDKGNLRLPRITRKGELIA